LQFGLAAPRASHRRSLWLSSAPQAADHPSYLASLGTELGLLRGSCCRRRRTRRRCRRLGRQLAESLPYLICRSRSTSISFCALLQSLVSPYVKESLTLA